MKYQAREDYIVLCPIAQQAEPSTQFIPEVLQDAATSNVAEVISVGPAVNGLTDSPIKERDRVVFNPAMAIRITEKILVVQSRYVPTIITAE